MFKKEKHPWGKLSPTFKQHNDREVYNPSEAKDQKNRLIFSLYIDIRTKELDVFDAHLLKDGQVPTNINTQNALRANYEKLIKVKQDYADKIGVEFKMVEDTINYQHFYNRFRKDHPEITTYNIVNFYKLDLLYTFSQMYDEVLYLDFDVVPMTNENFFKVWDLDKGITVLNNDDNVLPLGRVTETTQTIRSPTAKFYNAGAMLFEKGLPTDNNVINTGIIGAKKKHLEQLAYFDNFKDDLALMTKLKDGDSIFPNRIVKSFGYDNETLFGVKLKEHNVPVQWLDGDWHYFFDKYLFIPKTTKFCHAINKRFDICWRNYEKRGYHIPND